MRFDADGNLLYIRITEYASDTEISRKWFNESGHMYQSDEFRNGKWTTSKFGNNNKLLITIPSRPTGDRRLMAVVRLHTKAIIECETLSTEKLKGIYGHIAKRYDLQHALITDNADQKGRRILVENSVNEGDEVLDCGSGTGTTGIMAAKKVGQSGKVTLFDPGENMLAVARKKVDRENLQERVTLQTGDVVHLPFDDNSFDVVLSTYSLCPLYDPVKGALELYRVTRPGGKLGVGHSTEPKNVIAKYLADRVEAIAWRFPWLSMGCRSVSVLSALTNVGGKVLLSKYIGVPLWPFLVFVIEKPAT